MPETIEYRVVWRWFTDDRPERVKVYKTRKGAETLLSKLRAHGGRFEHVHDDPYEGEVVTETLELQYARLEWRSVGPWRLDPAELAA